jgi:glycosyltransferase involved in cell wall biosynthesis
VSTTVPHADVGVVMPTRDRPQLLRRALASVAAQTVPPREVIVVLDGPDSGLQTELEQREDLPIKVVVVDPPRGPSHARNAGVDALESRYVAFLDDDDEWLPRKLERQIPLLEHADISYTRVVAQGPKRAVIWPGRLPRARETASEYLFDRLRPWSGGGLMLTSTIATHTAFARQIRFDATLRQHDDWDWALRAIEAGKLAFSDDVLTIWHIDANRLRRTHQNSWRDSLAWAQSRRSFFTARAYSGFLLVNAYSIALRARERSAAATLAREAVRNGAPTLSQWGMFAALTLLAPARIDALRFLIRGRDWHSAME